MKKLRGISLVLAVIIVLLSYPVFASNDSPAYKQLLSEAPVYTEDIRFEDVPAYFLALDTDSILAPDKCNYVYGDVYVGQGLMPCHVYMRTFNILNASEVQPERAAALAQELLGAVRASIADKYIRCIAETYSISLSAKKDQQTGLYSSLTVKIFFAVNEKTEDRAELMQTEIAGLASELMPLPHGERFIKLNEYMLSGRFSYDPTAPSGGAVSLYRSGKGVCEEYAAFTCLVLKALGYGNRLVTGEANGVRHIWNAVTVADRVYHLDILWNGPIKEDGTHGEITRDYLLVSNGKVSLTHTPDEACFGYISYAEYDFDFDAPAGIQGATELGGEPCLPPLFPGLTVGEIKTLTMLGEYVSVYDGDRLLEDGETPSTGSKLVVSANGMVIDELTLLVIGDLDRDGAVTDADLDILAEFLIGNAVYGSDPLIPYCSDVNRDGNVTVSDLVGLYDLMKASEPAPETPPEGEETGEETTEPDDSESSAAESSDTDAQSAEAPSGESAIDESDPPSEEA